MEHYETLDFTHSTEKAFRKTLNRIKMFKLNLLGMNAVKLKCNSLKIYKFKLLFSPSILKTILYSLNRIMKHKINFDYMVKCTRIIIKISTYSLIFN